MRKRSLVLLVALIALAAGGMALWDHLHQSSPDETPPPPIPVVATTVMPHPVPIYLRGIGTVIAFNNVVVRSQITGPLINIPFKQGETVHEGDLLAEIDPRPYQAQLDQAIANRDRDCKRRSNNPSLKRPGLPVAPE
jgi:multidrug efflux system membrane fusion protein